MEWVRVLTYHSVDRADSPLTVSAEQFELQMHWVKAHFTPIRLSQLLAFLDGATALPRQPVLVTFDDGYRDNKTAAFPILARHGIPALIFVATGFVGSTMPLYADMVPTLSWEEIRELHGTGLIDFGAHTRTHIRLPDVPESIAWEAIHSSKLELENNLGVAINVFCYPQGRYDPTVIGLVRRAGFLAAFGGEGFVHRLSSPFQLPRIQVGRDLLLDHFGRALDYDAKWLWRLCVDRLRVSIGRTAAIA